MNDNIQNLVDDFLQNPERINELSPEELANLRKYVDPIGNIVKSEESFINISILNLKEDYIKKLTLTAMIGYLYRVLDEYEPDDEVDFITKKWDKMMNGKSAAERDEMKQLRNDEIKLAKSIIQANVRKFLNRHLKFNPDKHLRAAHTANSADPERKEKSALLDDYNAAIGAIRTNNSDTATNPPFQQFKSAIMTNYQDTLVVNETLKSIYKTLANGELPAADKAGIVMKRQQDIETRLASMKSYVDPISAAETINAVKIEPPIDVFFHITRYITNHYEQLRQVVKTVYNEKPDIELAVIYYDHFPSLAKARDHQIMHADDFRAEVLTISNTGITLIGPFKENRERVDFYNKHTDVMKEMMKQMESDHKLGKDIMSKEQKAKKIRNIKEVGPDAPGLAEYTKSVSTVQDLGAKSILTREEQEKLNEAQKLKDLVEGVDDAIEVGMFYPTQEGGDRVLKKTAFYSQSEAPLHLQDGSAFAEQYQPRRTQGEKYKIVTKKVTDRNGNVREVKDLADAAANN